MIKDWQQIAQDHSAVLADVRKGLPEVMKAFGGLAQAATAEGALSSRTKELVALALGVAVRCDGCIAFHARAAQKFGASREEILEIVGMGIYMGGGPSLMYGAQALEAYDQFAAL